MNEDNSNNNPEQNGGDAPQVIPDFMSEFALYHFPNGNGYQDFYTSQNQPFRDDHNALFCCLGDDYSHHVHQGPQTCGVQMADRVRSALSGHLSDIADAAPNARNTDEEHILQVISMRGDAIREADPNGMEQMFETKMCGNARLHAFMMSIDTDPMFGTGVDLELYCHLHDHIVEVWHGDMVLVYANGDTRSNFGQIPIRDVIIESNGNHGYRLLRHRRDRH